MGCPASRQCADACRASESSQHPMCPHAAHRRRCTHHPPAASHSTQPVPLGGTAGSTAVVMDASLPGVVGPTSGKTSNQTDSISVSETKCVGVTSQLCYLTVTFGALVGLTANLWSLSVRLEFDDDWTACGTCRRVPLVVVRVRRSAIGVAPCRN